jgi:hypothetical protein
MTAPKLSQRARDYLARAALSQGVYLALVEDALSLLPAADLCRAGTLEPLESYLTGKDIAAKSGTSLTAVRGDLRRLEHFGWVRPGTPRLLGTRDGLDLFLLADVAAHNATGATRLISREVLHRVGPVQAPPAADTPEPGAVRGPSRKWVR